MRRSERGKGLRSGNGGEPLAGAYDLREQFELASRPAALAFETRLRQA
jgi:hypothetical protein